MSSDAPRDATAFEVREALGEPGCVVCRLTLRSVARYIRAVAYEQVNDIALREVLRRARGLCNPHAHQWLREAKSVLGTALIYRDVLRASLADLDGTNGRRGGLLQGLLGGSSSADGAACPVCTEQADAERRFVAALVATLGSDAEARHVFEGADGVCRRHALATLRLGGPGAATILARTRSEIETLLRELDEVIRKEDYRFRQEERTEDERSAPSRAVAWAAGLEGLNQN